MLIVGSALPLASTIAPPGPTSTRSLDGRGTERDAVSKQPEAVGPLGIAGGDVAVALLAPVVGAEQPVRQRGATHAMSPQRIGVVEARLVAVGEERFVAGHGSIVRVTAAGSFPAMPRIAGRAVALVVCVATVALAPGRVLAHTELDFSLPANGTTVGDPVEEISVGFTDQVALVGNGFEVHDPQGNLLTPFVVTDDNMVFRFQLDPPLAGGVVTVDYHVRALDGDVQEGSFSFTVAAPLATSHGATATSATGPGPRP